MGQSLPGGEVGVAHSSGIDGPSLDLLDTLLSMGGFITMYMTPGSV